MFFTVKSKLTRAVQVSLFGQLHVGLLPILLSSLETNLTNQSKHSSKAKQETFWAFPLATWAMAGMDPHQNRTIVNWKCLQVDTCNVLPTVGRKSCIYIATK